MKARLVVSVVVGLVAGAVGSVLVTPEGDPLAELAGIEQRLESAFKPQVLFLAITPASAGLKTYEVIAPGGRVLEVQWDGPPFGGRA